MVLSVVTTPRQRVLSGSLASVESGAFWLILGDIGRWGKIGCNPASLGMLRVGLAGAGSCGANDHTRGIAHAPDQFKMPAIRHTN